MIHLEDPRDLLIAALLAATAMALALAGAPVGLVVCFTVACLGVIGGVI